MSSAPPPSNPPPNPEKKSDPVASDAPAPVETGAMDVTDDVPPEETWDDISEDILALSTDEILTRARLIDNDIKVTFPSVVFLSQMLKYLISGYAIGNSTVTTRTKRHEREDSRQWREDKAEQSSAISCRERCRGVHYRPRYI